ncbi:MAG: hypothetical protein HGGPFJEG_01868 [Ignavibacteria bacterium]|nr:hypothetical protein [Ignavibacteria bacterium]
MTEVKFAAFLRGVNVTGYNTVKMNDLKKILEKSGLVNVKTFLNSGNVTFNVKNQTAEFLESEIEKLLLKHLNLKTDVIVRELSVLQEYMRLNPFVKIKMTPEIRLYVTFSKKNIPTSKKHLAGLTEFNFKILKTFDKDIFSFIDLSGKNGTVVLMKYLELNFGKDITTRNWNTIVRILEKT